MQAFYYCNFAANDYTHFRYAATIPSPQLLVTQGSAGQSVV